jgi:hypothetical protein
MQDWKSGTAKGDLLLAEYSDAGARATAWIRWPVTVVGFPLMEQPEGLRRFPMELGVRLLTTVGPATIDRPGLALRVESVDRVDDAKALLVRNAAYVVSTTPRLEPGGVVSLDGGRVKLEIDGGGLRVTAGGPVEDVEPVSMRLRRRRRRGGLSTGFPWVVADRR